MSVIYFCHVSLFFSLFCTNKICSFSSIQVPTSVTNINVLVAVSFTSPSLFLQADTHKVEEKFEAADEKSVSIPHVETVTAELKFV